jgi:hypothetical protein
VTGAEMAARRTAAAAVVADFRAELARHPLSRPPDGSWAFRLAEEVGSLLGQPDAGLSPNQRAVLGQALADAITLRDPQGSCPDCDQHPAGLCEDHGSDLHKTDAYLALARELGIEVER